MLTTTTEEDGREELNSFCDISPLVLVAVDPHLADADAGEGDADADHEDRGVGLRRGRGVRRITDAHPLSSFGVRPTFAPAQSSLSSSP